ncbi:hypothetical protein PO124_15255 [Bacillus licheniformis]|nr:hypothetical protein [Bacillus licheniformis]
MVNYVYLLQFLEGRFNINKRDQGMDDARHSVVLAGDSTVCDYDENRAPRAGWGRNRRVLSAGV